MKKLSKLKLHEASVMSNMEMRRVIGGGYSDGDSTYYNYSSQATCVGSCFNSEYQSDGSWKMGDNFECNCVPFGM